MSARNRAITTRARYDARAARSPVQSQHAEGETHRGHDRRGNVVRLTFRPEWSRGFPWAAYENGTALNHYATLEKAVQAFEARGYVFSVSACV
jgi:hypothetical protein